MAKSRREVSWYSSFERYQTRKHYKMYAKKGVSECPIYGNEKRKPANFYIRISILYALASVGGQVQRGRAKGWNMPLPRKTGTLGHNLRDKRLLVLGRIDRKTPIERALTTPCEDTWMVRRMLKTFKDPSFLYPHYPFPFYLIFIHNTAFTQNAHYFPPKLIRNGASLYCLGVPA